MSYPGSGRADFYEYGGYNAVCYECGRKRKASMMKKHGKGTLSALSIGKRGNPKTSSDLSPT